jgi:L-alanine-DL-glutamate epimerase-like enolase superfamily enzyme
LTSTTPAAPTAPPIPAGGALTIEAIEVTPIIVPLDREYRGSYYHMTNRATVVTRVLTREGIVGEAYAGDEDATLGQIAAIVTDEIAPRLIGENAFAIERCWQLGFPVTYDQLRDKRVGLVALASVDFAI